METEIRRNTSIGSWTVTRLAYAKLKPTGSFVMDVGRLPEGRPCSQSLPSEATDPLLMSEVGFFLAEGLLLVQSLEASVSYRMGQ
jgi:hypothetical protein